jgi:hypothetical protein
MERYLSVLVIAAAAIVVAGGNSVRAQVLVGSFDCAVARPFLTFPKKKVQCTYWVGPFPASVQGEIQALGRTATLRSHAI